jgi:CHAT domain-containing protein
MCRITGGHERHSLWVLIALLAWPLLATAQSQARAQGAGVVKDDSREAKLERQKTLREEMVQFARQGKKPQAVDAAKRFIEIERAIAGENTHGMVFALRQLAELAAPEKDAATTIGYLEKALEAEIKIHGEDHWHVTDVRGELNYARAVSKLPWDQREAHESATAVRSPSFFQRSAIPTPGLRRLSILPAGRTLDQLRHALFVVRRSVGENVPRYCLALEQLAETLRSEGNPFAAAVWADRCLAARERVEGRRHPNYLRAMELRAGLHVDLAEYDLARPILERAGVIAREIADLDPRQSSRLAETLGLVLSALGELDGAVRAYTNAARLTLQSDAEGSPDHVRILAEHAIAAGQQRDFAAARDLWDRVLAYGKSSNKGVNSGYERALTEAAIKLGNQGDREGAIMLHRAARGEPEPGPARRAELLAPEPVRKQTYDEVSRHAEHLRRQGKLDEAVQVLESQITALRKAPDGRESDLVVYALEHLANTHVARGDYIGARKAAEQRFQIVKGITAHDGHWQVIDARLAVAQIERLERLSPDRRRRIEEVRWLADSALALAVAGLFDAASDDFRQAHSLQVELMGDEDPDALDLLGDLGTSLSLEGRDTEAEAVAARALALNRRARGPRHPATVFCAVRLAWTRKSLGNLAGARSTLVQVGEAKRPPQISGTALLTPHHVNGLRSGVQEGFDEVDIVLRPGSPTGPDRDIAAIRSLAEAERIVIGSTPGAQLESLIWIANRHLTRHQFDDAIATWREIVAFFSEHSGPNDWWMTEAKVSLAEVERMAVLARRNPALLSEAENASWDWIRVSYDGKINRLGEPGVSRSETIRCATSALILWRKVLGERAPRCLRILEEVGVGLREQGQLDAAERALTRAVELRLLTMGEHHPSYALALRELGRCRVELGRTIEGETLLRQAVSQLRAQIGKSHAATAITQLDWARALRGSGDLDAAHSACQEAVAILRAQASERDPALLTAVVELAAVLQRKGDYPGALKELEAVEKLYAPIGLKHFANDSNAIACATALATLRGKMGDFAQAKVLLDGLLDQVFGWNLRDPSRGGAGTDVGVGKSHPEYAGRLQTLADLLMEMGDSARAYDLYREAMDRTEELLGPDHPAMADRMVGLARALVARGSLAKAEELLDGCEREVMKRGERDALRSSWLATRAANRVASNAPAEAARLLELALGASARAFGEGHPEYIRYLNELAGVLLTAKNFAAAQTCLAKGLALSHKHNWTDPLTEPAMLVNLARSRAGGGDSTGGSDLYRSALSIRESHIARNLSALAERERLVLVAKFREPFLEALDVTKNDPSLDGETFGHVIFWKGIATAAAREVGISAMREQKVFLDRSRRGGPSFFHRQLVELCYDRLIAGELRDWPALAGTETIAELLERQRQRQRAHDIPANIFGGIIERLGFAESNLAEGKVAAPQPVITPDQVSDAVPEGAVLLDFVRYEANGGDPRYAAFVVGHAAPVRRIELGLATPVDVSVRAWLQAISADSDDWDSASELYRKIWAPIASLCRDAKLVLVSPDGELNRVPWGALPDLAADSPTGAVLLERHTFAHLPSARRLVEGAPPATRHNGLLAVGGVDYDRREPPPGMPGITPGTGKPAVSYATSGPPLLNFPALSGTADEIKRVREIFEATYGRSGVTITLSGSFAEKTRVMDAMRGMRYILLATHGFSNPPAFRQAFDYEDKRPAFRMPEALTRADVTTVYPGLLSGLVVAGFNKPPLSANMADNYLDCGANLLTAQEVVDLDLSGCELAVLSACETGIGQMAGGEGVLGLQRAFHVAGARFVVASLWQVSDDATRRLMSLFFENVWVGGLSPPEALRRAQLSMLREDGPVGEVRGPGRLVPSKARVAAKSASRRRFPRLWAAWVVSGVPEEPHERQAITIVDSARSVERLREGGRPQKSESLHTIPPGWLGGKLEPFLAVTVDSRAGDAFTTSADGLLLHYDYPDFALQGSYKLPGAAYQLSIDSNRGLLFAIAAKAGELKTTEPDGRPRGTGDLHVFDVKTIRDGTPRGGFQLKPTAVVPLGASVSSMIASKGGLRLFCLEDGAASGKSARLVRIDTTTDRVDAELDLPESTQAVCMTPDGSALFAAATIRPGPIPNGSNLGEGAVLEIDPEALKVRRTIRIPLDPNDIQANDKGLVFISGGHRFYGTLAVLDLHQPETVGKFGNLVPRCLRLSADQKWLFVSNWSSPPSLQALPAPTNLRDLPNSFRPLSETPEIPLGGDLFLTPGGDYLLTQSGGVIVIGGAGGSR